MSKKVKFIIGVLSIIIVILLIIIIVLLSKNKSDTEISQTSNKAIKNIVGIYHNNNWNGKEASLYLNEDMSCKYPNTNDICNWTIEGQTITIMLKGTEHIATYTNSGIDLHEHLFYKVG